MRKKNNSALIGLGIAAAVGIYFATQSKTDPKILYIAKETGLDVDQVKKLPASKIDELYKQYHG